MRSFFRSTACLVVGSRAASNGAGRSSAGSRRGICRGRRGRAGHRRRCPRWSWRSRGGAAPARHRHPLAPCRAAAGLRRASARVRGCSSARSLDIGVGLLVSLASSSGLAGPAAAPTVRLYFGSARWIELPGPVPSNRRSVPRSETAAAARGTRCGSRGDATVARTRRRDGLRRSVDARGNARAADSAAIGPPRVTLLLVCDPHGSI